MSPPRSLPSVVAFPALALACVLGGSPLSAQAEGAAPASATPAPPQVDAANLQYGLRPRSIAEGVWVIEGAVEDFSKANGCNIINTGFVSTPQGVWVINTGPSRLYGEQQKRAIAATTPQAVAVVLNLNLHPDYFFGNQAWQGVPLQALPGTMSGMRAEGKAYEDNLFRLCGDWMKGTEHLPASTPLAPGRLVQGGHDLELKRFSGHTADDLVLIDHTRGVLFAGGLVFLDRVPTTPHADLAQWRTSLTQLRQHLLAHPKTVVVPSHGPVHTGTRGVDQTLDWINWLDQTLRTSAAQGLDLGEVLRLPVPARFAGMAAQPAEYVRSVTHLYPQYELDSLPKAQRTVTQRPVPAQ